MEKCNREYSKPRMVMEKFVPQDFVAACGIFIPTQSLGSTFWADIMTVTKSDSFFTPEIYSFGPDGKAQRMFECFTNGKAPSNATSGGEIEMRHHWYENVNLYKKIKSSSMNDGELYSNSEWFSPLAGYSNVAIYIKDGVNAYIYTGNNGSKPSNPSDDWQAPTKTMS